MVVCSDRVVAVPTSCPSDAVLAMELCALDAMAKVSLPAFSSTLGPALEKRLSSTETAHSVVGRILACSFVAVSFPGPRHMHIMGYAVALMPHVMAIAVAFARHVTAVASPGARRMQITAVTVASVPHAIAITVASVRHVAAAVPLCVLVFCYGGIGCCHCCR